MYNDADYTVINTRFSRRQLCSGGESPSSAFGGDGPSGNCQHSRRVCRQNAF